MDYRGDDSYPDCNTPGLIVDDVSPMKDRIFLLLTWIFEFLRSCMTSWSSLFLLSVA